MSIDFAASLSATLPLIVLVVWTCVLLLVDLFIPKDRKGWTALLAALGLLASLVLVILRMGVTAAAFGGMVVVDGFSNFLAINS